MQIEDIKDNFYYKRWLSQKSRHPYVFVERNSVRVSDKEWYNFIQFLRDKLIRFLAIPTGDIKVENYRFCKKDLSSFNKDYWG